MASTSQNETVTGQRPLWVLLDDRAGNRSQALGVVEALGIPFAEKMLDYNVAAKLPNILLGASLGGLTTSSKQTLQAPWPELVISAGRRTAPVARWVKLQSGGTARLVQIMDPGAGRDDFDLLCLPAHDQPRKLPNSCVMAAAPHGMTQQKLDVAASEWSSKLSALKAPRIAVMVGGSTRRRTFTPEMARDLFDGVRDAADMIGAGLMVTTSRRTGEAIPAIESALDENAMLHRWDSGDENPYAGYLALADAIIVTGESVSMCSEACGTGKPVYIYAPAELVTPKHGRLHTALYDGGYARPFAGAVDLAWHPPRLSVVDDIAAEIRSRSLLPKMP